MNHKLMFSHENNSWCTPKDFFDKLNEEFNFTLDPCCTKESALCKKYFTPEDDGLKKSWGGEVVFCNPPYGKEIKVWVKKCYEESLEGTKIVLLIPARTDTTYFHDYIYGKAEIRLIRGRLKFIDLNSLVPKEKWTSAPFPSMLAIFN